MTIEIPYQEAMEWLGRHQAFLKKGYALLKGLETGTVSDEELRERYVNLFAERDAVWAEANKLVEQAKLQAKLKEERDGKPRQRFQSTKTLTAGD